MELQHYRKMNTEINMKRMISLVMGLVWLTVGHLAYADQKTLTLESFEYTPQPGGKGQLQMQFSGPAPQAGSFTIDNPARIAIDLPNTKVGLRKKSQSFDAGITRNIRFVEAGGRTRVVLSLSKLVPFDIRHDQNVIYVTLNGSSVAAAAVARPAAVAVTGEVSAKSIENIDFRRGRDGEGKVIVTLSDPTTVVDITQKGERVQIDFIGTRLPERLERRLDVTDFATPVTMIDALNFEGGARVLITPVGDYEQLAYQADNTYTIDFKRISKEELEKAAKEKLGYTGDKLSLNFQNIEVRAVLQLIADFTGLNIVASDTVTGNITLRLKNVPWDQALDIILKTRGLGMRQAGNVLLIAPNEEIAAREKQELEAKKQVEELAPLRTEYFQINYAKAADIAALLKAEANTLLSDRGNVTIDDRTNILMVLDTADKLEEIGRLVEKLDIPIRQVLIESRIVIANDDFSRDLGVRTGVTYARSNGVNGSSSTTGTIGGTDTIVNNTPLPSPINGAFPASSADRLNVNLPVANPTGSIAFAILGSDYLVDLELSAMEKEGEGELISNPRVVTSNQKEAVIEAGVEIPYQEATSSGATSVSFKKAVLSLSVTPQITPDDRVVLDLSVSNDSVGEVYGGIPTIDTNSVTTQVLVDNGDTVVLGGIYTQEWHDEVDKVPLLGDIPVLGYLFKTTRKMDDKSELLIFVTPKILKEGLLSQFD